ncbi:MAG: hypothetical protein AB1483_01105 [Candidatus Zixiibacteriota bacterium]
MTYKADTGIAFGGRFEYGGRIENQSVKLTDSILTNTIDGDSALGCPLYSLSVRQWKNEVKDVVGL